MAFKMNRGNGSSFNYGEGTGSSFKKANKSVYNKNTEPQADQWNEELSKLVAKRDRIKGAKISIARKKRLQKIQDKINAIYKEKGIKAKETFTEATPAEEAPGLVEGQSSVTPDIKEEIPVEPTIKKYEEMIKNRPK